MVQGMVLPSTAKLCRHPGRTTVMDPLAGMSCTELKVVKAKRSEQIEVKGKMAARGGPTARPA